ncbi:MAG: amino acid ABC transporter permease [Clostridia bacterium]
MIEWLIGVVEWLIRILPKMLMGSGITLLIASVGLVVGLIFGLLLALGRLSKNKIIDRICFVYIWLFRGTPLLMQLFFIYYALPLIYKPLSLEALPAAFIAFSLNSAAYLAEIIRAAIQSIDKGQMEASKALGMGYGQAMKRIIIPQSYRRLIPPVGNEFIMLLKDTALVSILAMSDLMRVTDQNASASASAAVYIPAAILYLLMTTILTYFFERLEKRYSVYE